MTRKRLRYSELKPPEATASAAEAVVVPASPVVEVPVVEPLVVERSGVESPVIEPLTIEPLLIEPIDSGPILLGSADERALDVATVPEPMPARPRRNSTPVELARTLTAERAAARAKDGVTAPVEEPSGFPFVAAAREPQRTLREKARTRSGTAELLMFRVGGERFAVELILVDEVIDLPVIHHVPEMPPAMLGVVTVRGSLTPVFSPQHALGLPLAFREALLIFRRGAQRVGILIDDVDDALTADLGELAEKPGGEEGGNVLVGVMRLANTLVGIVDADALITACQSANILEPA